VEFYIISLSRKVQKSTSFGKVTINFTWHINFGQTYGIEKKTYQYTKDQNFILRSVEIVEIHQEKGWLAR
jgi:hypothetical protein